MAQKRNSKTFNSHVLLTLSLNCIAHLWCLWRHWILKFPKKYFPRVLSEFALNCPTIKNFLCKKLKNKIIDLISLLHVHILIFHFKVVYSIIFPSLSRNRWCSTQKNTKKYFSRSSKAFVTVCMSQQQKKLDSWKISKKILLISEIWWKKKIQPWPISPQSRSEYFFRLLAACTFSAA